MFAAAAVMVLGSWLLMQTVAGRLPARLLSYRAGELGTVADAAPVATSPTGTAPTAVGTVADTIANTGPGLRWPTRGGVSQEFHPGHDGMDIFNEAGTAVFSAGNGIVSATVPPAMSGGYGNLVKVAHGVGLETWYAHLNGFAVRPGQRVDKGQSIGPMGSTGHSTGPHLHFEVRRNGTPVNPRIYIGGNP